MEDGISVTINLEVGEEVILIINNLNIFNIFTNLTISSNKAPVQLRTGQTVQLSRHVDVQDGESSSFNNSNQEKPLPSVLAATPQHFSKPKVLRKLFLEASQDLRPNADKLGYWVGFEGFSELTLQTYDEIRVTTPGFVRRVTPAL